MPDYRSDAGLLSHLQKQAATINEYKTEAGATAADIAAIEEDAANVAAIIPLSELFGEYKTTGFGIKRAFMRGEIGSAVGKFMTAPDTTMPFPLVAGAEKRSRERDARFKLSTAMTAAARIALDLNDEPTSKDPNSVVPTIELFPAQMNYDFAVVIGNRVDSDMSEVQIRRQGEETWATVKSGTGKAVNVKITPKEAGKAEKIEVRVLLFKNNQPYGQPSAPAYTTVVP